MSVKVSRRWFIGGLASYGAFGGNRVFCAHAGKFTGGKPNLTFGVVSDVHVRLGPTGEGFAKDSDPLTFIHTLEWFRDQDVDAVMIVGDIADKGLVDELQAVADAWFKVFPDDKAPTAATSSVSSSTATTTTRASTTAATRRRSGKTRLSAPSMSFAPTRRRTGRTSSTRNILRS